MFRRRQWAMLFCASCGFIPTMATAQNDVADIPSKQLKAEGDDNKAYFLIGGTDEARMPKSGFGLVVVLPGGSGSADFHPFVKRILKNALPDGYLIAQPIAVKWTTEQKIVWPTEHLKVEGQKFSTEAFIESVIRDVAKQHKVNKQRIYTLSWSSSGPAAYAAALREKTLICGSFVAMSVFKPTQLPDLKNAKGRLFYIYHSPDDRVCPFRMAEEARDRLTEAKAQVEFKRYAGGHGWRGNLYGNIRAGIDWLESKSEEKLKREQARENEKASTKAERAEKEADE